ncbi:unnamed protein product, partial [Protopolystoma xenopodis]
MNSTETACPFSSPTPQPSSSLHPLLMPSLATQHSSSTSVSPSSPVLQTQLAFWKQLDKLSRSPIDQDLFVLGREAEAISPPPRQITSNFALLRASLDHTSGVLSAYPSQTKQTIQTQQQHLKCYEQTCEEFCKATSSPS